MIHRDLYRYLIPSSIISIVSGMFGWVGLVAPQLLGWSLTTPFFVKALLFILGCLPILSFFSFRNALKSTHAFYNETPLTMYLEIETEKDSESTSYYACLQHSKEGNIVYRIPVYPPSWNCESVGQVSAQVFIDSVSKKPLVVEVKGKRLWSLITNCS